MSCFKSKDLEKKKSESGKKLADESRNKMVLEGQLEQQKRYRAQLMLKIITNFEQMATEATTNFFHF